MFILIPLVLIFLCVAYLQLNDGLSIYTQSFVYLLIVLIVLISFYLYRAIKNDMKTQELNKIQILINELTVQSQKITDETQRNGIVNKIRILEDEYNDLSLS